MTFPCKYANLGCTASLAHTEKLAHEEICEYRNYTCPCPGNLCGWQGRLDAVVEHIETAHGNISILEDDKVSFQAFGIDINTGVAWVVRLKCFGQEFLVRLEKQPMRDEYFHFCAAVQLIGAKAEAEKYVYRIEMDNGRQRLTWRSTPLALQRGTGACFCFETPMAEKFTEAGKLQMIVTISTAETSSGTETDPFNNRD